MKLAYVGIVFKRTLNDLYLMTRSLTCLMSVLQLLLIMSVRNKCRHYKLFICTYLSVHSKQLLNKLKINYQGKVSDYCLDP